MVWRIDQVLVKCWHLSCMCRHCRTMAVDLNPETLREAGIGNFFRPSQLEQLGITYHKLRQLEAQKAVQRVGWGLYRLAGAEQTERHSIASVCARVPNAVVCLLSALRVHEIGKQLPRQVWIAIPHKARPPRLGETGIRLVRFSGAALSYGVQETKFEDVPARITSPGAYGRRLFQVRAPYWARDRARSPARCPERQKGQDGRPQSRPGISALPTAQRCLGVGSAVSYESHSHIKEGKEQ